MVLGIIGHRIARFRPPVGMVPVIFPLLRSITLMVLSPSLTQSSSSMVMMPLGPEVAPLLVVPVNP